MRETPLGIEGAVLIHPDVYTDHRGFFCALSDYKHPISLAGWVSRTCMARSERGVIRGMHIRKAPGEAKLVRCSAGSIRDFIVDLRPGSPTYLTHVGIDLNGENQRQVYIPAGCAHGYQALADNTDVQYRIDGLPYRPADELVLDYQDTDVGIRWPLWDHRVSAKDRTGLSLANIIEELK